jgi:hypothetical protein
LLTLVAIAAAAAVLAVAVLAAAGLRLPGALETTLLGTAAAVALLALPCLLRSPSISWHAVSRQAGVTADRRSPAPPGQIADFRSDPGSRASGSRLRR